MLRSLSAYWLLTQLFNFWGSYKVVDSEGFNFYFLGFWASESGVTENPIKLETGLRPNSAGIPYALLLMIEAMGFPTFGLLL